MARSLALAALLGGCAAGTGHPSDSTDALPPAAVTARDAALRDSLVAMARADQEAREGMTPASVQDTAFLRRMAAGDSARTRALAAIIREHGWPTPALVGDTAVEAAWLIAIHSPSMALQREVLALAERAPRAGQGQHLALLTDKILTAEGKPQRYGTQMDVVGTRMVLKPVEDSANLDARRAEMGLLPLEAYMRMVRQIYRADTTS